jgi:hypothetical protein
MASFSECEALRLKYQVRMIVLAITTTQERKKSPPTLITLNILYILNPLARPQLSC